MADKFDPYREALVLEIETVWPESCAGWEPAERQTFEKQLHATASEAAELHYIRTHTGFCRQIVVTDSDIERLGAPDKIESGE